MLKKTDALWHLFLKFCSLFSKDSSDLLSTLSTSLELLRLSFTPEGEYPENEISLSCNKMTKLVESPLPPGLNKQPEQIKEEPEPMEVDVPVLESGSGKSETPPKSYVDQLSVNVEPIDEVSEDLNCKRKSEEPSDHALEKYQQIEFQNSPSHVPNHQNSHQNHSLLVNSSKSHTDFDASSNPGLPSRRLTLSTSELALIMGWHRTDLLSPLEDVEGGESSKKHPIYNLEKLLRDCCVEEESLENLHESVLALIRILESEGGLHNEQKGLFCNFLFYCVVIDVLKTCLVH